MEVTLNPSWHLWVANFGTKRINIKYGTDICEYTRAVIKGASLFILVSAICGLGALWVGASLWNIATTLFAYSDLAIYSKFFLFVIFLIAVLIGVVAFKEWWDNRPLKDKPERPPTFAAVAYRKFKNKTCFRIKFNDV